jgi:tetratricopeptide (TPR) repeat protein
VAVPPCVPGYEILGELGGGGMGIVYKARQSGLNRLVALKMMRREFGASAEAVNRFRIEAEAVARLQHPNIVAIHEIGAADGGPYLSLELVSGPSLAQRLAGAPLPPRQAAEITRVLARAIHFAHQHGVLHRDLKPSNILLQGSGVGGQGAGIRDQESGLGNEAAASLRPDPWPLAPKITDFGLAKLLGQEAGLTQTGLALGTPSYMAPEQAQAQTQKLGPATDVYALGAVLYEMLTGRPPFRAATPLETLKLVVESEPVRPAQLQPQTPRDLDTICLKCLQKDPQRRYLSAADLADDCAAYLLGQPIKARPVGPLERGWKWVRSHPTVSVPAAVISFAILVILAVVLAYNFRLQVAVNVADEQRTTADMQRNQALADRRRMLAAANALLVEVADKDLEDLPGMEEARQRLLARALEIFKGILSEKDDPDPAVRRDAAGAFKASARIHYLLSDLKAAVADANQALALYEGLAEEAPTDAAFRLEQAAPLETLTQAYSDLRYLSEAEAAAQKRCELLESLPLDEPQRRMELARASAYLGVQLARNRLEDSVTPYQRKPDAPALARKQLDQALRLFGREDLLTDEERHTLASTHLILGMKKYFPDRSDLETEDSLQKARAILEPIVQKRPEPGYVHSSLANVYFELGKLKAAMKRPRDAEEFLSKSLNLRQQRANRQPNVPGYRGELAASLDVLATLYASRAARPPSLAWLTITYPHALGVLCSAWEDHEARSRWEKHALAAFEHQKFIMRKSPENAENRVRLSYSCNFLGFNYAQANRPEKAEAVFRETIELMESVVSAHSESPVYAGTLGTTLMFFGRYLTEYGKSQDALPHLARATSLLETVVRKVPDEHFSYSLFLATACGLQADVLSQMGRNSEAEAHLTREIDLLEDHLRRQPQTWIIPNGLFVLYVQRMRVRTEMGQLIGAGSDGFQLVRLRQQLKSVDGTSKK